MRYHRSHRSHLPSLWIVAAFSATATLTAAWLPGCASSPLATAQTPEQKAFAVYGSFVIYEEQAARLATDPSTPGPVRQALSAADARAKPSADALLKAFQDYSTADTALKAGTGTPEKLQITAENLDTWVQTASNDINTLITTVKGTGIASRDGTASHTPLER